MNVLLLGAVSAALPPLKPIGRGALMVVSNWLPADLTVALRDDAVALEKAGNFVVSGLSNTAKGAKQGFGAADRGVCAINPALGGNREARADFQNRLNGVIDTLKQELDRPGLQCREQYYSLSGPGARLARHMDERHEELKGARGSLFKGCITQPRF